MYGLLSSSAAATVDDESRNLQAKVEHYFETDRIAECREECNLCAVTQSSHTIRLVSRR